MNKTETQTFLGLLEAKLASQQARSGWVLSTCPLAHWRHASGESSAQVFGVRIEPGDARVNCFACGFHGTQTDLVVELSRLMKKDPMGAPDLKKALQMISAAEEESPLGSFDSPDIEEVLFGGRATGPIEFPGWWIETFPLVQDVAFASAYLKKRGVPLSVSKALGLRADSRDTERRVCFPILDKNGKIRGFHGRTVETNIDPRYRMYTYQKRNNPLYWLGESWVDPDKPVVVVEGPMDLASVYRVYRNVVSPLFANPSYEKIARMADAVEVITLLDKGTGGDMGRARMKAGLKHSIVTHVLPPADCKDPGEMSVDQLVTSLEKLVPLDPFLLD